MGHFHNSDFRHGSARIADRAMLHRAGVLRYDPYSLFSGYTDEGDIIWYGSGKPISGVSVFAAPRAGKMRDWQIMNLVPGASWHSQIVIDLRGVSAYMTETIGHEGRRGIYWNALGLPGLPQHSMNPTEDLTIGSPYLFEDLAITIPALIQSSGASQAIFFEQTAQRYCEALCLMIVARDGVLTLPALFDSVQALNTGGSRWNDQYDKALRRAPFSVCTSFADEVQRGYEGHGSGFEGVCAELAKCLKCLSSPRLRESLSPPYDFSFKALTNSDQLYTLYLLANGDFITAWNPIYRLMLSAAYRAKQRAPSAPKQIWYIDEASAFKRFDLLIELYSRGAGDGIIPVSFWQNTSQTKIYGNDARLILGAGLRVYFSLNDSVSAQEVSSMIGYETLSFDDETAQNKDRHSHHQAMLKMMDGDDIVQAGMEAMHYAKTSRQSSKIARLVRQPSELLRMPDDRMWMWMEGVPAPIYARRVPFYKTQWMAGRYTGSPSFDAHNVEIMTPHGPQTRRVISCSAPERFAHLPQYQQGGAFKYVDGFRPW